MTTVRTYAGWDAQEIVNDLSKELFYAGGHSSLEGRTKKQRVRHINRAKKMMNELVRRGYKITEDQFKYYVWDKKNKAIVMDKP